MTELRTKYRQVEIYSTTGEGLINQILNLARENDIKTSDISFDHEQYYEYGDSYSRAYLEYKSIETVQEAEYREREEQALLKRHQEIERQQYEALKAKFEKS